MKRSIIATKSFHPLVSDKKLPVCMIYTNGSVCFRGAINLRKGFPGFSRTIVMQQLHIPRNFSFEPFKRNSIFLSARLLYCYRLDCDQKVMGVTHVMKSDSKRFEMCVYPTSSQDFLGNAAVSSRLFFHLFLLKFSCVCGEIQTRIYRLTLRNVHLPKTQPKTT